MPTLKIELYKGKTLSDGRYPICVRSTSKGKIKRKSISSAFEKEWDDTKKRIKPRTRPDFQRVNDLIETEFRMYDDIFISLKRSGKDFDADEVFKNEVRGQAMYIQSSLDFMNHIKEYRSTRTYLCYKSHHDSIMDFTDGKDFNIEAIDDKWVERFFSFHRNKGASQNAINIKLMHLTKIIRKNKLQEVKALSSLKLTLKRPARAKLTSEELEMIETANLTKKSQIHARDVFMMQYYLRGMRIGDVLQLQWSNIVEGRMVYVAMKTNKANSIKIIPQCQEIINRYKERDNGINIYIFPWIRYNYACNEKSTFEDKSKLAKELMSRISRVNESLKVLISNLGITKKVTSHISRHSFAANADKKLNGDLRKIQDMLGHSDRRMTELYIQDLRNLDEMDDAADKIFG